MPAGPLVACAVFIMIILCRVDGQSSVCSDREHSPLCFCQSSYRRSLVTDIFLARLSLSQCAMSHSVRQCRQGRFYPSTTHVTQLVPNLVNLTHCLREPQCLHMLPSIQRCHQCQIIPSLLSTDNTSHMIRPSRNNLSADSCFHVCEHDQSCGFLCFDRRITAKIQCDACRGRRRNVTCRCVRTKSPPFCLPSNVETTTERWMQKRGFPAAGILALLVLVTILVIIGVKFVTRHLDTVARRKNGSIRRSIATITTYRSRQPSPSAAISLSNTPCLPLLPMRTETATTNTMVDLLNGRSQEYVVDIHRHAGEDELSVFLLEKAPSQIELEPKDMIHIDDDDKANQP